MSTEHEVRCPVEITLDVIGGKWKAIILFHLLTDGTHRFAKLKKRIAAVSDRVLTKQLRELESDGIVERKVFPEVPPRVEYSITPYGETLELVTKAMCEWGESHSKRTAE